MGVAQLHLVGRDDRQVVLPVRIRTVDRRVVARDGPRKRLAMGGARRGAPQERAVLLLDRVGEPDLPQARRILGLLGPGMVLAAAQHDRPGDTRPHAGEVRDRLLGLRCGEAAEKEGRGEGAGSHGPG